MTLDTLNPRVVEAKYAVRGALVARAAEIQNDLKNGKAPRRDSDV